MLAAAPPLPYRRESFRMPSPIPHRSPSSPRSVVLALLGAFPAAVGCVAVLLCAATLSPAQTSAQPKPQGSSTTQPKPHPAPARRQARKPLHPVPKTPQATQPAAPATQALVAPAPQLPHWPVNDKPTPARVVWDSRGLRIDAANASLSQILTEVSTLTGAHVEGFGSDARVYGQYGPAPAREVLSQLLEGTGYNVMMIGDLGQGAPRQIVLSIRVASASIPVAHTAPTAEDDADVDEPAQAMPVPNPGQPLRAPFNPAGMRNLQHFPPDMRQPGQQLPQNQEPLPGQQPPQPNQ